MLEYQLLLENKRFSEIVKNKFSIIEYDELNIYFIELLEGIKLDDTIALERLMRIKDIKVLTNAIVNIIYNEILYDATNVISISKEEISDVVRIKIEAKVKTYKINYDDTELYAFVSYLKRNLLKRTRQYFNRKLKHEKKVNIDMKTVNQKESNDFANDVIMKVTLEKELTKEEYQLFQLRYIDDCTFKEIAKIMNMCELTIKRRNRKLKEKIKLLLF